MLFTYSFSRNRDYYAWQNIGINDNTGADNERADTAVNEIQKDEGSRKEGDAARARKRVRARTKRHEIDKGLDRKVDGRHTPPAGTCNEKVFRFCVCGAGWWPFVSLWSWHGKEVYDRGGSLDVRGGEAVGSSGRARTTAEYRNDGGSKKR